MTDELTLPLSNTRYSGRTSRMLIRALSDAGAKEKVFVVASTRDYAMRLRANLFAMAHALHLRTEPFSRSTNDINIEGTLYMFYGADHFNNIVPPPMQRDLRIYEDHFVANDW